MKRFIKKAFSSSQLLSRVYRSWRDSRDMFKEPEMTHLGFKFNGNSVMAAGKFEIEETHIIRNILPNVTLFINIGANIGYYTCIALSYSIKVIAFEPMTMNQFYLYRNILSNQWQGMCECFPIALGQKCGLTEIYGSGTGASLIKGWSGQYYKTIVPVSTLDTIVGDRLNNEAILVLIDVEGSEYDVLMGANKLLSSNKKSLWFVEISITDHQPKGIAINPKLLDTFKIFYDNGYYSYTADFEMRRITLTEIERVISSNGASIINAGNFLFVHKSNKILENVVLSQKKDGDLSNQSKAP